MNAELDVFGQTLEPWIPETSARYLREAHEKIHYDGPAPWLDPLPGLEEHGFFRCKSDGLWVLIIVPSGYVKIAIFQMAHRNNWFTELKDGYFPVRYVNVYQRVSPPKKDWQGKFPTTCRGCFLLFRSFLGAVLYGDFWVELRHQRYGGTIETYWNMVVGWWLVQGLYYILGIIIVVVGD